MAAVLGALFGIGLIVLCWVATWDSAKKRKIGLSITSYLALFLTPLIAYPVTLFTKKINKSKEQPTYQQRLPYEKPAALLVAAILYVFFSIGALMVGIMSYINNISGLAPLANFVILLILGISLFSERKKLLLAKEQIVADENVCLAQETLGENCETMKPSFVFESNVQQRITMGTDTIDTSKSYRRIFVEHNGGGRYTLSILDGETGSVVLQPIPMHNASYSDFEECLSMESDDNNGEYTLNVFYKDEQVCKCVVYRKSKDFYIHYNKE